MNEEMKRKLLQLIQDTKNGYFGEKAKSEYIESTTHSNIISYFTKFIYELYQPFENDSNLYKIAQKISEYLLILYIDTKVKKTMVANALYFSLFNNFPSTINTNLFDKYRSLLESSISFKNSIVLEDKIVLWTLSKKLIEDYNEFLNGLLGYINICAKVVLGKKYNPNIFNNSYQAKIDEFTSLKLNYIFPVISNLINVELRNAIAHSMIIHNAEDEIEYTFKKGSKFETKKISLAEFVALAATGTYLTCGYIASLAMIFVFENGNILDIAFLPSEIKSIYYSRIIKKINI